MADLHPTNDTMRLLLRHDIVISSREQPILTAHWDMKYSSCLFVFVTFTIVLDRQR